MGQLERYGLYVLCVVIVLILGVAIWGGDTAAAPGTDPSLEEARNVMELDKTWEAPDAQTAGAANERKGDAPGFFTPVANEGIELAGLPTTSVPATKPEASPAKAADAPAKPGESSVAPAEAKQGAVQLVTYTVRKDDTMEKIAKTELRDARLVGEIRALNPDVDPNRMPLGTVLKLPWIEGAAKPDKAVAASTTREHQIRSGDTLEAISQQYYGTAAHTKLLQEHNKIKDPRRLKPGKTLEIPPLPK